ncbi:hypothetical protein TNCV_4469661 [Trichonephila clavipes]|nr:hypothetical protein TNCV_4469661 [Trichonephila clavipes]
MNILTLQDANNGLCGIQPSPMTTVKLCFQRYHAAHEYCGKAVAIMCRRAFFKKISPTYVLLDVRRLAVQYKTEVKLIGGRTLESEHEKEKGNQKDVLQSLVQNYRESTAENHLNPF